MVLSPRFTFTISWTLFHIGNKSSDSTYQSAAVSGQIGRGGRDGLPERPLDGRGAPAAARSCQRELILAQKRRGKRGDEVP